MSTNILGIRNGNQIIPYGATTKRTKKIPLTTSDITGGFHVSSVTSVTGYIEVTSDSNGVWFAEVTASIHATYGNGTGWVLNFPNLVFNAGITQGQGLTAYIDVASFPFAGAKLNSNDSSINIAASSTIDPGTTDAYITFKAALNAEPTAYTAANMEGAVNASVYIPAATDTVAGLLSSYEEYTLTSNILNLDNVAQSFGIKLVKIGNTVTLTNTVYATGTKVNTNDPIVQQSLPIRFRPLAEIYAPWSVYNNNVWVTGAIRIETDGSISFKNAGFGAWTGSGACAVERGSISYVLT